MKDKIKGKIDKHFHILANGRKCKILNYKKEDDCLTIITKFKNSDLWEDFDDGGEICIEEENKRHFYVVKRDSCLWETTIFRYYYLILKERIETKGV